MVLVTPGGRDSFRIVLGLLRECEDSRVGESEEYFNSAIPVVAVSAGTGREPTRLDVGGEQGDLLAQAAPAFIGNHRSCG
jgi:hypothetical protein